VNHIDKIAAALMKMAPLHNPLSSTPTKAIQKHGVQPASYRMKHKTKGEVTSQTRTQVKMNDQRIPKTPNG
jgi:hypothetical protein